MKEKKLYATGEIAKMAGVTIRTIRYYDSKGVLKPSKHTQSGHRLYTEEDLSKLKRVLALKYLGLSLEEVMSAESNNFDKHEMIKSLQIQKIILQNKIHQMKTVLHAIEAAEASIKRDDGLNWGKTADFIKILEDEKELRQKYIDTSNLDAEIRLIERFGINKDGWYQWAFNHINLKEYDKVLEIGCGNGALWSENAEKLPKCLDVTLTEVCEEMFELAKRNMGMAFRDFKFEFIHPEYIPYPDESFDVIVANHILFYLKNVDAVLGEISRVLKKGGSFYCSTVSENHMKELEEILKMYNKNIVFSRSKLLQNFGFENGAQLLSHYFNEVTNEVYVDKLIVDDSEMLLEYIYSMPGNILDILENKKKDFEAYVQKHIDNKDAEFSISNASILFKSVKH